MAKQLLRIDLDTSFSLFGISCHLKDFRFAWTINKSLSVDFKKSRPYVIGNDLEFSQYEHTLDSDVIYLFANKSHDGFLIKKMKQVDYWMLFHNTVDEKTVSHYISIIRKIQPVLTFFEEDNKQVKEHFLF
ncbi:MAG: IPExxxVDY family protein [Bacteroidota bacterium]|nr:IPExxxVDY family protein [Bacteroidota bacterium]